jgi:hypothetical protein
MIVGASEQVREVGYRPLEVRRVEGVQTEVQRRPTRSIFEQSCRSRVARQERAFRRARGSRARSLHKSHPVFF